MFWALEDLEGAGEIGDREACLARLAAWFHDAVYDPHDAAGRERGGQRVVRRHRAATAGSVRGGDPRRRGPRAVTEPARRRPMTP